MTLLLCRCQMPETWTLWQIYRKNRGGCRSEWILAAAVVVIVAVAVAIVLIMKRKKAKRLEAEEEELFDEVERSAEDER